MIRLKLDLNDLLVESFDTSPKAKQRGTVFGQNHCTCISDCSCPGCPTCDPSFCDTGCATCPGTCEETCDGRSCWDTCGPGCNNVTESCRIC